MTSAPKLVWLLGMVTLLVACVSAAQASRCQLGEQEAVMDSLYFGTSMPQDHVRPEDWQGFLSEIITPRFPEGLTSWTALGQWQNGAGLIQKENAYILHIAHPDSPQTDTAIRDVVSVYKTRFHQEAVLRVRSHACISF